ncbi:MAG: OB-fold domain-containing protein [Actinomycetia bacterium]|nr:OB-fold domain-containing protein [Actinomycetes bacterium]
MNRTPVLEGSFVSEPEPALVGSRCRSCETVAFPASFTCPNPRCMDKDVAPAPLSRTGRLASWTTVHFPPPPPFVAADPFVPITVVEVDFASEGIQVVGPLTGAGADELRMGMPMETVVEPYYADSDGEVIGWKFRPVEESNDD